MVKHVLSILKGLDSVVAPKERRRVDVKTED